MASFEQIVRELLLVSKRVDQSLHQLQERAAQIQQKYAPREEFDRWKQTLGGRRWKQQQYERQQRCCMNCQQPISLKGSHIDHVKPLSRYPSLAIAPDNLQILCAECNTSKGNRERLEPQQ